MLLFALLSVVRVSGGNPQERTPVVDPVPVHLDTTNRRGIEAPEQTVAAPIPPATVHYDVSDVSMRGRLKKLVRESKEYARKHPVTTTAGVTVVTVSLFVALDYIIHKGDTSRMWTRSLVQKTRKNGERLIQKIVVKYKS